MFHMLLWFCLLSDMSTHQWLQPRDIDAFIHSQVFSYSPRSSYIEPWEATVYIGALVVIGSLIFYKTCINPHLSFAIGNNSLSLTRRALSFGTDVNQAPWFGHRRALHSALERGYFEIVRLLLRDPTINVNITDDHNRTPLDYALKTRTHQRQALLSLLCAHATDYDRNSQFLTDELRTLLQIFVHAKNNTISFYDLVRLENIQKIFYNGVFFDLIAFALRNNNHNGLEECIENKYFDYDDVFMTLAENTAFAKLFSVYAEKELNFKSFKKAYLHAKENNNTRYINAAKKYITYSQALQTTKLSNHIGELMLIRKILSYVNCDSE